MHRATPDPRVFSTMLRKLQQRLPTHTRRSEESQHLQQYSTQLELAALLARAAAITPADVVLEPSAARPPPFKRNDRILDVVPVGRVAFPGSGITDNLVDKAHVLGVKVFDHRTR